MSIETSTDASGVLSFDNAVAMVAADDALLAHDPATEAPTDVADDDEDEEAQLDLADDQAADEDDAPGEDDPASEDDLDEDDGAGPVTATAAPEFWSAEEKALFAKAPPEVQQLVAAKVADAEKRVYSALEDTAAARKEASIIVQTREQVDQLLGQAEKVFQGKWDGVDWPKWAKEAPDEAFAAKLEFEAEQELLGKLRTVQAATEAEEHRQFVRDENVKLAAALPELADPKEGPARKRELIAYLQAGGFKPEDLKWAGATELAVAYKAMRWDKAMANLARKKAKADPALAGKPAGSARPTAVAPPRKTVLKRRTQEVVGRALKTGGFEDGVAALAALEG